MEMWDDCSKLEGLAKMFRSAKQFFALTQDFLTSTDTVWEKEAVIVGREWPLELQSELWSGKPSPCQHGWQALHHKWRGLGIRCMLKKVICHNEKQYEQRYFFKFDRENKSFRTFVSVISFQYRTSDRCIRNIFFGAWHTKPILLKTFLLNEFYQPGKEVSGFCIGAELTVRECLISPRQFNVFRC